MRDWIGTAVAVLGSVVSVVVVIRLLRRKAYRGSPALNRLEPDQRREVLRRIRSDAAPNAGEPAEVHEVARDLAARNWMPGIYAGLLLVQVGQLIRPRPWPWVAVHLLVIALVGVGVLLMYRDVRRARRFH